MSDGESILQDLRRSVETWDNELMHTSVDKALDMGMEPKMIVTEGLAKGMDAISDLFNNGKIFLPQVLAASNTMDNALAILEPMMVSDKSIYRGTVIMGSVRGDIHEIGKNVCCAEPDTTSSTSDRTSRRRCSWKPPRNILRMSSAVPHS